MKGGKLRLPRRLGVGRERWSTRDGDASWLPLPLPLSFSTVSSLTGQALAFCLSLVAVSLLTRSVFISTGLSPSDWIDLVWPTQQSLDAFKERMAHPSQADVPVTSLSQGPSFVTGQLQGPSLVTNQLQGSSLVTNQLQGPSLVTNQLQGPSLVTNQLQGPSLVTVQSQGRRMDMGQSQVGSVGTDQSPGYILVTGQSQSPDLVTSQLQGPSLVTSQSQDPSLFTSQSQSPGLVTGQSQGLSSGAVSLLDSTVITPQRTVSTPQRTVSTPQSTVSMPSQDSTVSTLQNTVSTAFKDSTLSTPQNTVSTPQNTVSVASVDSTVPTQQSTVSKPSEDSTVSTLQLDIPTQGKKDSAAAAESSPETSSSDGAVTATREGGGSPTNNSVAAESSAADQAAAASTSVTPDSQATTATTSPDTELPAADPRPSTGVASTATADAEGDPSSSNTTLPNPPNKEPTPSSEPKDSTAAAQAVQDSSSDSKGSQTTSEQGGNGGEGNQGPSKEGPGEPGAQTEESKEDLKQDSEGTQSPLKKGPGEAGAQAEEDLKQDLALMQQQSNEQSKASFSQEEQQRRVARGCGAEEKPRLGPWMPTPGKYLLAYCTLYGLTNRLYCTQHALLLAALLNRTLIVPPRDPCDPTTEKAKSLEPLIHVPHLRECLMTANLPAAVKELSEQDKSPLKGGDEAGADMARALRFQEQRKVAKAHGVGLWAVSLAEYQSTQSLGAGGAMQRVDVVVPWCHQGCPTEQCSANGALNLLRDPTTPPWIPERDSQLKRAIKVNATWVKQFGESLADMDVVAVGDTYFWDVEPYGITYSGSLAKVFGSSCQLLLQPSPKITKVADDFRVTMLQNRPYAAVYLRLGDDFQRVANRRGWSFFSVEDATKCLVPKLVRSGVKQVFVATDRFDLLPIFEDFLQLQEMRMVVFGPPNGLTGIEVIAAEKLLCAQASVFFYADNATFSLNVQGMRAGLGVSTCDDEPYCKNLKEPQ